MIFLKIELKSLAQEGYYEKAFIQLGRLGHGHFGTVYEAKNKIDHVTYAVKKIEYEGK